MAPITKKTKLNNLSSKLIAYRIWFQSAFLLLWLDPLGLRLHGMCSPVFHCYSCPLAAFACPIGVLANFSALHLFPFIAVGLLIVVGALFGSLVCGWACPFGLLQDLLAKIPTPKFDLPKWTGNFRYVVLVVTVLAVPYFFGKDHPLFICSICPAGALEAAVPNIAKLAAAGQTIVWPSTAKVIITVLIVAAMFLKRRPWCRLFCPLGAIFSLFNRISAFFLRFDAEKCNNCLQCHKLCKYGIEPEKSPNDVRCIRCLECINCPQNALSLAGVFKKSKKTS